MTRDQVEVAKRLVDNKHWKWRLGTVYRFGSHEYRVNDENDTFERGCVPDLNHSVTVSRLEELAREAWGDDSLHLVGVPAQTRGIVNGLETTFRRAAWWAVARVPSPGSEWETGRPAPGSVILPNLANDAGGCFAGPTRGEAWAAALLGAP